jgi:hypothetical protein
MDAFKYRRTIAEGLAGQRKNKGLKPSKFNRGISDVTQQTDKTSEPTLPEHRNSSPQDGRGYQARFAKPYQGPSAGERNNIFQSSGDMQLSRSTQAHALENSEKLHGVTTSSRYVPFTL